MKADGTPYTVYTPFSRAWKALPLPGLSAGLPVPEFISTPELASVDLLAEPPLPKAVPFPPGELEAQRRLKDFVGQLSKDPSSPTADGHPVIDYTDSRNRLDLAGTSQLSPYLRFGMLSARQAVMAALEAIEVAPIAQAQVGAQLG